MMKSVKLERLIELSENLSNLIDLSEELKYQFSNNHNVMKLFDKKDKARGRPSF